MFIERKNKFLIIAYKILDLISTNKKKELETRVEFCLKLRIYYYYYYFYFII